MKINVEFDLTPDEFRQSLGLPDVEAFQKNLVMPLQPAAMMMRKRRPRALKKLPKVALVVRLNRPRHRAHALIPNVAAHSMAQHMTFLTDA